MTEQERQQKIAWNEAVPVRALVDIPDCPAATTDGSARAGQVGVIIDQADGWLFVDFGRGVIITDPSEVIPVRSG